MKIKLINEIEVDDRLRDYLLIVEEALQADRSYIYTNFENGDRHQKQSMFRNMNEYEVIGRLVEEQDYILKIINEETNADKIR